MKKFIAFIMFAIMASVQVYADDYGYLIFQQQDGTTSSVTALGTTITFSGGNLIATQDGETTTIALASMDKMYFSSTSGIDRPTTAEADGKKQVYTTAGNYLGTFDESESLEGKLQKGLYVIKQNGETRKVVVR